MCGFVGVVGVSEAAREIFVALQTLQHRGQDSAGIATKNGHTFPLLKDTGTVPLALAEAEVDNLEGSVGLGHVRYPTFGKATREDAQPFFYRQPGVLMTHNGNVTNYTEIKETLLDSSIHLLSTCDIEPVLCLFADELQKIRPKSHTLEDAVAALGRVQREVEGAYTFVAVLELDGIDTMLVYRDTYGIRPGVWGSQVGDNGTAYMAASESVALDALGYQIQGEIVAGGAIFFRAGQEPIHRQIAVSEKRAPCIFEHIYFARPDSVIDGETVYETRLAMGKRLALEFQTRGHEVDTVIPIPDTSRPAATALAEALRVPLREGFIKNRYFGRTFIMPNHATRTNALRLKLNPIRKEIEGRRVLLVDDSIVRGNTVRSIVALVRDMNPAAIHLGIYSPPVTHPCYYGIDMSRGEELIARRQLGIDSGGALTLERQRKYEDDLAAELSLDSLTYLSLEGLDAVVDRPKCAACFDGKYPLPLTGEQRVAIEVNRNEIESV